MASKERGLGRGIGGGLGMGALFGDAALEEEKSTSASTLPIAKVQPGLNQPRKRFDPEGISQLADSIRLHGVLQPITVRLLASGYYQIIAGERRWRAAKEAGLTEVPVVVIQADDKKVMELGLIENLQREDLNPMEEALGYQSLISDYGLTQEETADRVGKSRPAVTNALRLLKLPAGAKKLVEEGKLSAGHARAVLGAKSAAAQEKLAAKAAAQGLSVREVEALAKKAEGAKAEKAPKTRENDLYLKDLEKELTQRFGRRVTFQPGKKKGLVTLEYYGLDDLDKLLQALRGEGTP